MIKQITVFLQNTKGRVYEILKLLDENEINLKALSLADSNDYGVLRIIVDDCAKAESVLSAQYMCKTIDVVGVELNDSHGGLADALAILDKSDIDVDYIYASGGRKDDSAYVILRVEESARAEQILSDNGFTVIQDTTL